MNSLVLFTRRREPVVVAVPPDQLEKHLFTTEAQRVLVPTPEGKPTWLTVDCVLRVEPAP